MPYLIAHYAAVVIDAKLGVGFTGEGHDRVAREVHLADHGCRNASEVVLGAEAEIRARHKHIVHVEQKAATGAPHKFEQEVRLFDGRTCKRKIGRGVFDQHSSAEHVLRPCDVVRDHLQRFGVERQGEQVVVVDLRIPAPRQMLGH